MITEKVVEVIESNSLLEGVTRLTVAVSGGADSVALLSVLSALQPRYGFTLSAAHLNHSIRGEEADRDEEFVKNLCLQKKIPLFCEKADVPLFARQNKISIELAARQIRYDFFSRIDTDVVATAHTASDNLETVLLNLTRGTALQGLCGIPAKRDGIIRPLLSSTRKEIEEYCRAQNLSFVSDSTNLSDAHTRNLLRHKVIPVLKQINPAAEEAAGRMCTSLKEDDAVLNGKAADLLQQNMTDGGLCVSAIKTARKGIATRTLRLFLNDENAPSPEFSHIESVYKLCFSGGQASLPGSRTAAVEGGKLTVTPTENIRESRFLTQSQYENRSMEATLDLGWSLLSLLPASELDRLSPEMTERFGR